MQYEFDLSGAEQYEFELSAVPRKRAPSEATSSLPPAEPMHGPPAPASSRAG
jgi:hypothetical protein